MAKNANFGPNLVVFGQNILFFTGEIKSFVIHITENPPRHFVQICFWSAIGQNVQKNAHIWPKMTKNAYFGPNLDDFGPKILIFMRVSKSFGTHIMEKPPRQLFHVVFWSSIRSNGPKMPVLGQILLLFGHKSNFWGDGVKLLVPSYQESDQTPFSYMVFLLCGYQNSY